MKNSHTLRAIIVVALSLGTAWAVRGKFGHEQGAAWAGAIGGAALILASKRTDWYDKLLKVSLASAFGWGAGGMISYGLVVGYGASTSFVNAWYGLAMLFVIGALYGFLGGGFFGLALIDSDSFKVNWHSLLAEMVAIGLLTYGFIINQLELLMTPPRSELWAACLGAAIALAWFLNRNNLTSVLTTALWAAIGAGFGFAFGNFLQVVGRGTSTPFNFWNVMEYSIGFFGGLGMAYGTLTSEWPVATKPATKNINLVSLFLLVVFIPLIVWEQSFTFETDRFKFVLDAGGDSKTILGMKVLAILSILICMIYLLRKYYRDSFDYTSVITFFIVYLGLYTFLSFLVTGLYVHPVEQYLYIVNIVVVLLLVRQIKDPFVLKEYLPQKWVITFIAAVLIIALLAFIATYAHGELHGSHNRFDL